MQSLYHYLTLSIVKIIDNVIIFNKLKEEDITILIKDKLNKIKQKYKNKNIKLKINNQVIKEIATLSNYKEYGARKIDKIIKDKIENLIIDKIIDDEDKINIETINEEIYN